MELFTMHDICELEKKIIVELHRIEKECYALKAETGTGERFRELERKYNSVKTLCEELTKV